MKIFRSNTLYIVCLLAIGMLAGILVTCQHTYNYRVMVIHSFSRNFPNYPEFNSLIESEFNRQGEPVALTFHYLDSEKRNHPEETTFIRELLDGVAPDKMPDLIISVGDQATYSLLVHEHPLIHRVPVVFIGVEFPNQNILARYNNVTGVTDSLDVLENLKVVREVIGERHLFTLMEQRVLDKKMLAECNKQLDGVPYVLNNLEWKNTMFAVRNTPDSLLTLTSLSIRSGQSNTAMKESSEEVTSQLGDENFFFMMRNDQPLYYLQLKSDGFSNAMLNFTNKEQFTATYHYFGSNQGGFVAGYFSPMKYQAADGVAIAIRVLRGEDPSTIPLHNSRKGHYIDWVNYRLHRNLPIDSIPAKYELVRDTFSDHYPHLSVWLYSIGGGLVALLILFLLFVNLRERRHKRRIIRQSLEERKMLKMALQNSQAFAWKQRGDEITLEEDFWLFLRQQPHHICMQDFAQYLHPDTRAAYLDEVDALMNGRSSLIEVQCDFRQTGKYEWWQIRANHLMKSNKEHTYSYGIILNIEGIKQREEELIRARKLAEQAELKEAFLANMSHEIRTPLNAIVGFSNILATPGMELEDAEKEEMMATINKNNDLLLKLVNDVIDLSRIESGHIILHPQPCALDALMECIYQSFCVQAPPHLRFELLKGEPGLTILGDDGRIQQVLMNFLTNAAKCTPQGFIHLGWQLSELGDEVELYVEDSGVGMTEEQQLMVFERFYKTDEFRQGSGLGLSICKAVAERLGARITLQSAPQQGSRFSLWVKRLASSCSDTSI